MLLDFRDEGLTDIFNNVLSGLLPHTNYDADKFGILYFAMKSVISLSDTRGVHYALYFVLDRYSALMSAVGVENFSVLLTRERFDEALSNNLPDLILEPQLEVGRLMDEEGKPSDINNPMVQQDMMSVAYVRCMNLYDTCYDLCKSCEDAMSSLVVLRSAMQSNIIETSMAVQRSIVSTGYRQGKRLYRGPDGWLDYIQQVTREIVEMQQLGDNDLVCDSLDILPVIDGAVEEVSESLGEYGIPTIDDYTPILKHRFSVLVARENTGKTKFVIRTIASLIRRGIKCFFACGESSKEGMEMEIVSSYIRQEYGMYFPVVCLVGEGFNSLREDDKQVVATAKARVATSGLAISTDTEYDNVISKFTRYYSLGYEAFFIDHSQSLRGRRGRPIGELVTTLALDCRDFKRQYPVYIMLTSQPSSNLKDLLQKDQMANLQISPTAQSAAPSQEADELFILNSTEYLKRQGLLEVITYKRRGAPIPGSAFIVKEFDVGNYVYDPRRQGADEIDEAQLKKIVAGLGEDEDGGGYGDEYSGEVDEDGGDGEGEGEGEGGGDDELNIEF